MSHTYHFDVAKLRLLRTLIVVVVISTASLISAAPIAFTPGEILVMDSNASQGNGLLFSLDRSTGRATAIGNGFGYEPWSMVLQSPTSLLTADATGQTIDRLNLNTGIWNSIFTPPYLAKYPTAAMVADSANSVLLASGFGKVHRVNTITGQETLFADYSSLGTQDPWGMTRLPNGSLAVADLANGRIVLIKPDGTSSLVSSGGVLTSVFGIAALNSDYVVVGEESAFGQSGIVKVSLKDGSQTYLTSPSAFHIINGLTLESNGNLLVAEGETTVSGAIYDVNPINGKVTVISRDKQFANPTSILIVPDPAIASVPLPLGIWSVLITAAAMACFTIRRRLA
jgi:hypothetical protein